MVSWSTLRKIGKSRLVQMTIFIPVIGYMIIFNDYLVNSLNLTSSLSSSVGNTSPMDEMFRLRLIYIGLCFLAFGSVLFILFCPDEISHQGTEHDYVTAARLVVTEPQIDEIKSTVGKSYIQNNKTPESVKYVLNTQQSKITGGPAGHPLAWADWSDRNQSLIINCLLLHYRMCDARHTVARTVTTILYIVGWVILLVPAADIFIRVGSQVLSVLR